MNPIYIRTDKNGTKIYHDWTCPRCGGAGMSDKWIFTGRVCYECGGSGKRHTAKIVKEYTPEYWAKLEAKRIAKAKKEEDERAKYAEEHKEEIAEYHRRVIKSYYAQNGCGPDGTGYVLNGNTYPVKEKIRAAGGKWIYGVWVCPEEITGKGINPVRIDISGCFSSAGAKENENGQYASDIIWDARTA